MDNFRTTFLKAISFNQFILTLTRSFEVRVLVLVCQGAPSESRLPRAESAEYVVCAECVGCVVFVWAGLPPPRPGGLAPGVPAESVALGPGWNPEMPQW